MSSIQKPNTESISTKVGSSGASSRLATVCGSRNGEQLPLLPKKTREPVGPKPFSIALLDVLNPEPAKQVVPPSLKIRYPKNAVAFLKMNEILNKVQVSKNVAAPAESARGVRSYLGKENLSARVPATKINLNQVADVKRFLKTNF